MGGKIIYGTPFQLAPSILRGSQLYNGDPNLPLKRTGGGGPNLMGALKFYVTSTL